MQSELFCRELTPSLLMFEELAYRQGYTAVAGVDEAGRGALAGPVVSAAVLLPRGIVIPEVTDSKKLTANKREQLFSEILDVAISVGVGFGDNQLIDRVNILQATLVSMKEAVERLNPFPDFLLIDGISTIPMNLPQRTIKKGDSASLSVAAASIVAKVTRDRLMVEYDQQFPGYGFALHKGYGAEAHMTAIAALKPCIIHRKSFRGVREHLPHEG